MNPTFRLEPKTLAVVTQYSQLIGCTPAEFLNRFLDDYLVAQFNDAGNGTREEFVCTFEFRTRADANRVIDWLGEGIGQTGWDLEAEALEQAEGTFKVAAAFIKGGEIYSIS